MLVCSTYGEIMNGSSISLFVSNYPICTESETHVVVRDSEYRRYIDKVQAINSIAIFHTGFSLMKQRAYLFF